MKLSTPLHFVFIVIISFSCNSSKKAVNPSLPPIKYKDYSSFEIPTTSYDVGYIFRVPKKGKKTQIYVRSVDLSSFKKKDDITFPKTVQYWDFTGFFKYFGLKTIEAKAEKNKTVKIEFSIDTCTEQIVGDDDIDPILKKASLELKKNNRYFIVTGFVDTKAINIKFFLDDSTGSEVQAKVKKDSLAAGFSRQRNDSTILVKNLKVPQKILYTVLEFNERGTLMGEGETYLFVKPKDIWLIPNPSK